MTEKSEPGARDFPTTRWSAIVAARSADPAERERSREEVAAAYWRPVYKHVRLAWRKEPADAEDLTQAFFVRLLESDTVASYDPGKARFRTFIKMCLDRFVANEEKAARRQKRGGGARLLSLDFADAEKELAHLEPPAPDDVERFFEREWVRSVFSLAVAALEREYAAKGKEKAFRVFARYELEGAGELTYAQVAAELGLQVTGVTNALHAARRDFRRLALECLRRITSSEEELEAEARALLGESASDSKERPPDVEEGG